MFTVNRPVGKTRFLRLDFPAIGIAWLGKVKLTNRLFFCVCFLQFTEVHNNQDLIMVCKNRGYIWVFGYIMGPDYYSGVSPPVNN